MTDVRCSAVKILRPYVDRSWSDRCWQRSKDGRERQCVLYNARLRSGTDQGKGANVEDQSKVELQMEDGRRRKMKGSIGLCTVQVHCPVLFCRQAQRSTDTTKRKCMRTSEASTLGIGRSTNARQYINNGYSNSWSVRNKQGMQHLLASCKGNNRGPLKIPLIIY